MKVSLRGLISAGFMLFSSASMFAEEKVPDCWTDMKKGDKGKYAILFNTKDQKMTTEDLIDALNYFSPNINLTTLRVSSYPVIVSLGKGQGAQFHLYAAAFDQIGDKTEKQLQDAAEKEVAKVQAHKFGFKVECSPAASI